MFESAFIKIANMLKEKDFNVVSETENINASGDIIKREDVLAHEYMVEYIKNIQLNIVGYISEESKTYVPIKNKVSLFQYGDKEYIIAFDPLDGSSNAEMNISSGTIYALYEYDSVNNKIIDIIKAGYCLYGPATILVETHYDNTIMKVLKNNKFEFCKNIDFNRNSKIKYISINNEDYEPEIKYLKQQYKNYKHRWIGTLVADAHRLLMNNGIFFYTHNSNHPTGKIRYYYEAIPMAFIFSKSGGLGINNSYSNILKTIKNRTLNSIHMTTSIILCSSSEYLKLRTHLDNYEFSK